MWAKLSLKLTKLVLFTRQEGGINTCREHDKFGFELLDPSRRFDRFEEGAEVITRLLGSHEPVSFEGEFYRLQEAILLPRPRQPDGLEMLAQAVLH